MELKELIYKVINDAIFIPIYFLKYKCRFKKLKIASIQDTIDQVTKKQISLSRFGDGEFKWIDMTRQDSFEKDSSELSSKLLNVLRSNNSNVKIGLPQAFKNPSVLKANKYWEREMGKYGSSWLKNLNESTEYLNLNITRPYIDLKNKKTAKYVFDSFKNYMINKKILIIEGRDTHFGKSNDLLSNSNLIERIECPSHNAFESYDKIYKSAFIKITSYQPDIVLIALGPTATILTYELANNTDRQVIDIGHFDIEYEWYLRNANKRVNINGKAVNEVKN